MPSLESLTNSLKQAYEAKDHQQVETLITPIKLQLIQNDLLLPNPAKLQKKDENYLKDLIISRSILEIGALSFINESKFDKFQHIIDSLKVFYFNESKELSTSSKKNKLLSLYLLLLLSDGDFVKFYTELEFYTFKLNSIETDLFLKYPITLANWLLEGYYDKVLKVLSNNLSSNDELSESKSKLKEFHVFDEILIKITREEIAKTLSKSYKTLDFKNARNLLHLKDNDNELENFIYEFNWESNNTKNELVFNDNDDDNDENIEDYEDGSLTNTEKLVKNSLNYAKEIDSII